MYLVGQGHEHMGPGTSMVQRYGLTQNEANRMAAASRGFGCGCAGLNGCPCSKGGLGLFDSGLDPSGWALPEFAIVGVGAYMVLSTVFTTKRAARRVRSAVSGAYKGARRSNPGRRKASKRR
jgi:hypothetical protein